MAFKVNSNKFKQIIPYYTLHNFKIKRFNVSQSTSKKKEVSNEEICVDLVRKHDYENFLSCLLLPQKIRRSAFAIHAFNVELALIRDMVSAPHLGLMRIKFWTDALDKIYETPIKSLKNPVCLELAEAKEKHGLSKMWLKRLIEAREITLKDAPFKTVKELEEYSEKSVTPVYFLRLETLNASNVNADHAASHLGKGQGIINHLRGISHNASRRRVTIPIELLTKHGVSQEEILRGQVNQKMCDMFFELASVAHEHIETTIDLIGDLPKNAQNVLLPVHSSRNYLKRLEKVNFNVFDRKVQLRNNYLPLILYLQNMKRFF